MTFSLAWWLFISLLVVLAVAVTFLEGRRW